MSTPVARRASSVVVALAAMSTFSTVGPAIGTAGAATGVSHSGTIGSYRFADSSSGSNRVACGISGGSLKSVSVPAPSVQPIAYWHQASHGGWKGQAVKWTANLQRKVGSSWRVAAHHSAAAVVHYGHWTRLPSVSAFSGSAVSGHGQYRIAESITWFTPSHTSAGVKPQGTVRGTMQNYRYAVATHNRGFCRNVAPTVSAATTATTFPGNTAGFRVTMRDADGGPLTLTVLSATSNGAAIDGFATVSGSSLVWHATSAQVGQTVAVAYRAKDAAGAVSPTSTVNVTVKAATAPTAPAVTTSRKTATSVHFAWGAGTAGSCPISTYEYQVDGGAWNATTANTGVDAGTNYSQSHSVTVRVTDSCGNTNTATGTGSTDPATAPTPPGVGFVKNGRPATSLHFSWGSATTADCAIASYAYQVNGGAFTNTSANSGFDVGNGYSQTYTVVLKVTNACGQSATSSATGATDPPPSISMSKGAATTTSYCTSTTYCAWIHVRMVGWAPGSTHTLWFDTDCSNGSGGINTSCSGGSSVTTHYTSMQVTMDGNGNYEADTRAFGYPGANVWVDCDGYESNHVRW